MFLKHPLWLDKEQLIYIGSMLTSFEPRPDDAVLHAAILRELEGVPVGAKEDDLAVCLVTTGKEPDNLLPAEEIILEAMSFKMLEYSPLVHYLFSAFKQQNLPLPGDLDNLLWRLLSEGYIRVVHDWAIPF